MALLGALPGAISFARGLLGGGGQDVSAPAIINRMGEEARAGGAEALRALRDIADDGEGPARTTALQQLLPTRKVRHVYSAAERVLAQTHIAAVEADQARATAARQTPPAGASAATGAASAAAPRLAGLPPLAWVAIGVAVLVVLVLAMRAARR